MLYVNCIKCFIDLRCVCDHGILEGYKILLYFQTLIFASVNATNVKIIKTVMNCVLEDGCPLDCSAMLTGISLSAFQMSLLPLSTGRWVIFLLITLITLMMEAVRTSEPLVALDQSTRGTSQKTAFFILIAARTANHRSVLMLLTGFDAVKCVAFASEAQFAVSFLVVQKFLQLCEHLPAVSADQYVRVTWDIITLHLNTLLR
jgi:hypothetical protein